VGKQLHAVPVLVRNYVDTNGRSVNEKGIMLLDGSI